MAININYEEEVLKILKTLDDNSKKEVLSFAKSVLTRPKGEPGEKLVERIRELNFDAESLREMEEAIEEAFNVVDDVRDINLDE